MSYAETIINQQEKIGRLIVALESERKKVERLREALATINYLKEFEITYKLPAKKGETLFDIIDIQKAALKETESGE